MTEPGNHSGTQSDLMRPLTRESDGRERALLEETLEAVREIRDLVREPAATHDDRIPASLRNLESRLDTLPDSLSGTIREAMEEFLATAAREAKPAESSSDNSLEKDVAGKRAETAVYLAERNLVKRFDQHDDFLVRLDGRIIKRDEEASEQIGEIHKTLRNLDNGLTRLGASISGKKWQQRFILFLFMALLMGLFLAGMLVETKFQLIQGLLKHQ